MCFWCFQAARPGHGDPLTRDRSYRLERRIPSSGNSFTAETLKYAILLRFEQKK